MNEIIINADDCGFNSIIDNAIEKYILDGKISSTTIMANMYDLNGAKRLFELYSNHISFGIHFNLTEGNPLLYSQVLLDYGYYVEDGNGNLVMNGQAFYYKRMPKFILKEIEKELLAQYYCLRDNNIKISHIDSHHHIHTSIGLLPVIPEIIQKTNCNKIRRMRNFMKPSFGRLFRQCWFNYIKLHQSNIKSTDWFCSIEDYFSVIETGCRPKGTIELMCHPGHSSLKENELLNQSDFEKSKMHQLINYNQII